MSKPRLWIGMVAFLCAWCLPLWAVTQKVVVAEDFTATWCQYCPGAARGLDQLDDEQGDRLVVVAYHASGDPFYLADYDVRKNYYGVGGIPTVFFDGIKRVEGGVHDGSMYSTYLPIFNQRKAVANPIDIILSNSGLNEVTATITNTSGGTVSGKLHFALIERHKAYNWQGMNELDYILRGMLPNANGVAVSIAAGETLQATRTFNIQTGWNRNECRMVVFVQGTNKEIYQGAEIDLPETIPMIALTSPNGGEIWEAGTRRTIHWNSEYYSGNVKLEYTLDAGANWAVIAQNVPNSGSYEWRLPQEVSGDCRVRIQGLDGTPVDISDGIFGIFWPGDLDGNGFLDVGDMLLLADQLAELITGPLEADLNGDGVTDVIDLIILYYEIAG
jgi:thiol-disulfide isomerase/thioredoxin